MKHEINPHGEAPREFHISTTEKGKLKVTATQDFGEFDNPEDILMRTDSEVEKRAVKVANLNTAMAIVGLMQVGLMLSSVEDNNWATGLASAGIFLLMTYFRSTSLEPSKELLNEAWQIQEKFETTLEPIFKSY